MQQTYTASLGIGVGVLLALASGIIVSTSVAFAAEPKCDFFRSLDIGIEGEDVLCLQKFLNEAGYKLAASGPGSPGSETDRFGGLTRDALAKWQKDNDISPAIGFFGPRTMAAMSNTGTVVPAAVPVQKAVEAALAPDSELALALSMLGADEQAEAKKVLEMLGAFGLTSSSESTSATKKPEPVAAVSSDEIEKKFKKQVLGAIRILRDAEELIEDGDEENTVVMKAQRFYEYAEEDLVDAMEEYFEGDTEEALIYVESMFDNATDALELVL